MTDAEELAYLRTERETQQLRLSATLQAFDLIEKGLEAVVQDERRSLRIAVEAVFIEATARLGPQTRYLFTKF